MVASDLVATELEVPVAPYSHWLRAVFDLNVAKISGTAA
jgi:hypothetical protein